MHAFHTMRARLDQPFHAALAPPETPADAFQSHGVGVQRPQPTQAGLGAREASLDLPSALGQNRERGSEPEQHTRYDKAHDAHDPLG